MNRVSQKNFFEQNRPSHLARCSSATRVAQAALPRASQSLRGPRERGDGDGQERGDEGEDIDVTYIIIST